MGQRKNSGGTVEQSKTSIGKAVRTRKGLLTNQAGGMRRKLHKIMEKVQKKGSEEYIIQRKTVNLQHEVISK